MIIVQYYIKASCKTLHWLQYILGVEQYMCKTENSIALHRDAFWNSVIFAHRRTLIQHEMLVLLIGKKILVALRVFHYNYYTFNCSVSVKGASGAKMRKISATQHATSNLTSRLLCSIKKSVVRKSASCLYSLFSSWPISWKARASICNKDNSSVLTSAPLIWDYAKGLSTNIMTLIWIKRYKCKTYQYSDDY